MKRDHSKEEVRRLAALCESSGRINPELYEEHHVKRGLRDQSGAGVVAGLTKISTIQAQREVDGKRIPCDGKLFYRGYDVEQLCAGFLRAGRFGYAETAYLLLFSRLPDAQELARFERLLGENMTLPTNFVRDVIMKAPSKDMMNSLSRSVLTLASYDDRFDDISLENVLRQCLMLISVFPMLAVYGYQAYNHYTCGQSFFIHYPQPGLSAAENLLQMLRPDQRYTPLEARILDLALVLHMEHGGGNNSSFTTHVVSSAGSDTYAVMASALGSLKGPRHGGANIKVVQMFDDLKAQVQDPTDKGQVADYLRRLLHQEAFDRRGLIYGMGHAVYSISDPRARVFRQFVEKLAAEKHAEEDFRLYAMVEKLAPEIIAEERRIYKGVSANVDFYSGLVYRMLNIPQELFTPIFAIARIVGWSAHRIEELLNQNKIIRPAYESVQGIREYCPLEDR